MCSKIQLCFSHCIPIYHPHLYKAWQLCCSEYQHVLEAECKAKAVLIYSFHSIILKLCIINLIKHCENRMKILFLFFHQYQNLFMVAKIIMWYKYVIFNVDFMEKSQHYISYKSVAYLENINFPISDLEFHINLQLILPIVT